MYIRIHTSYKAGEGRLRIAADDCSNDSLESNA